MSDWLTIEDYKELKAWAEANPVILPDGFTVIVTPDAERLEEGMDPTGKW